MAVTPEMADVYERDALDLIELHRVRFENTGNPLYVWKAISLCFTITEMWRRSRGERVRPPGRQPHPFPEWCVEHLGIVATRMDCLCEGKDFRLTPKPFGELDPSPAAYAAAIDSEATLTPSDAAELIKRAMGIVRDGRNAFDRLKSLESMELDDFAAEALRHKGRSASETMNIMLSESGINDERSMRRRIQEARRARGTKPTP